MPTNRTRAPRVTAPALVLHGDADALIGPHHADDLAAALPSARLERFVGAGHNDELLTTGPGWAALPGGTGLSCALGLLGWAGLAFGSAGF